MNEDGTARVTIPKSSYLNYEDDLSIMQLDVQFTSNLRLALENKHNRDGRWTLGGDPSSNKIFEKHVVRFERYVKMPMELRLLKEKLQKQALESKEIAQQMREEEMVNPWLITDFDQSLDGNPYAVE